MCRFVAYAGTERSPADLVYGGSHSLYRQSWEPREMLSGVVNADGIGVAWYADGGPVRLLSDRPAWHEPEHRPLLESVRSTMIVASVRNATEGLTIDRDAVAPVALDGWTFTLNGYVTGFRPQFMRAMREALSDDLYGRLSGSSDTETLFLLAVERVRAGADPAVAVAGVLTETIDRVQRGDSTAQLNTVFTDGTTLVASRASSMPESNSLYVNRNWAGAPGGVTVASEPLDSGGGPTEGWERVPDRSLVVVRDGAAEIRPLQS